MSARPPVALRVRAAAKVNLVLRVGPARPDGYHDLVSLFAPIDLADEVRLRVFPGRRGPVTCRVPGRPELEGAGNLAARAAEAFRLRFGVRDRVDLTIAKRIPVTAGLGGGSADAAAALRLLARAYGVRDREALAALALSVGSDVPFFLGSGPAWARGRGERLSPIELPPLHLVLAYPPDPALAIRAGDAYRWLDAARAAGEAPPPGRARAGRFRPSQARNDLEGPCFGRHPRLKTLAGRLMGAGAVAAIMSGSGPTVFGIFRDRGAARRAATAVGGSERDVELHVVRTLERHPGVLRWTSPRSASSRSARRSSRRT